MIPRRFLLAASAFLLTSPAWAALDTAITTEFTAITSDVKAVGGLALLVVIGLAAFKYMKRAV